MSVSHTEEVAPQVFDFMDRAQASLPQHCLCAAKGVCVASPDLIRELDEPTDPDASWRLNAFSDGFDRLLLKEKRMLRVRQFGQFWYIQRLGGDVLHVESLVFPFENVPFCTRTREDAMRLAEHCSPIPRSPVPGCWVGLG